MDHPGELKREALAKLECITHPRIRELWQQQIQTWRTEEQAMAVVVIPLLFEAKVETEFDAVICVACTGATQQTRLVRGVGPTNRLRLGWRPNCPS